MQCLAASSGEALIGTVREERYVAFRTTDRGAEVARRLAPTEPWSDIGRRSRLLRRAFKSQTGAFLKNWIYDNFPEVTGGSWGESI
jgi:hypothetical protein